MTILFLASLLVCQEKDYPNTAKIDFARFPKRPAEAPASMTEVSTADQLAAAVAKGGAIRLKPGKYALESELSISKSVRLVSEKATIVPANAEVRTAMVITADDVTVEGLTFEGFAGMVIVFGRTDGSTQKNLVFSRVTVRGGSDGFRSLPIETPGKPQLTGLLLHDVRLEDQELVAFNIGEGPVNDIRLEKVTVKMRPGNSENSGADAIAVENGDNVFIAGCDVSGAEADGIDLKATRVCVYDTVVHDLGRNGVKFWRGGDLVNCLVYNTGADASIVFDGGGAYRILHTTVAFHARGGSAYALTCGYGNADAIQLTIENSIFYRNAGSLWTSAKTELAITNTILFGSGSGYELAVQKTKDEEIYVSRDDGWGPLEKMGKMNFALGTEPKFVDAEKGDFRLKPDSPGIDGGLVGKTYPGHDRRGGKRILGKGPDLGPEEIR